MARLPMRAAPLALLLAPAPAAAQDPYRMAVDTCWLSVVQEVRRQFREELIFQDVTPRMDRHSNAENRVSGTGTAKGKPFRYSCIYNIRDGRAYDIRVSPSGYPGANYPNPGYPNPGYPDPAYPGGAYPGGGYDRPTYPGSGGDWVGNRVPSWAVGRFEGVNPRTRDRVRLDIRSDGRVVARINGQRQTGTVRDGTMHVGLYRFILSPARGGLTTQQRHDPSNIVYYRRVR